MVPKFQLLVKNDDKFNYDSKIHVVKCYSTLTLLYQFNECVYMINQSTVSTLGAVNQKLRQK